MSPDESVPEVRRRLLDGMARYLRRVPDCGYTQRHIDRCAAIVDAYLAAVAPAAALSPEGVCGAVREAVMDLNDLNAECRGGLIETDQRELLCRLILTAARRAGLNTRADITEAWRTW
ncbi:MAG TPA: hypothetical protein VD866_29600 [Urbifossiella sp.]|nr:hypothetical protein [Urbifossiella sp.]